MDQVICNTSHINRVGMWGEENKNENDEKLFCSSLFSSPTLLSPISRVLSVIMWTLEMCTRTHKKLKAQATYTLPLFSLPPCGFNLPNA